MSAPRRAAAAPKAEGAADRAAKRNYASYSTFIYKVLKQVHPDTGISNKVIVIFMRQWRDLEAERRRELRRGSFCL